MKNKNLAIIHILKKKLSSKISLSEENYRALLLDNYKVSSSKDLSLSQQKELISLLNHQLNTFVKTNQISDPKRCSNKQINYILFLSKNKVSNLLAYCSKIIDKSIDNIHQLSKQEGITIINSLQRYHRNKEV